MKALPEGIILADWPGSPISQAGSLYGRRRVHTNDLDLHLAFTVLKTPCAHAAHSLVGGCWWPRSKSLSLGCLLAAEPGAFKFRPTKWETHHCPPFVCLTHLGILREYVFYPRRTPVHIPPRPIFTLLCVKHVRLWLRTTFLQSTSILFGALTTLCMPLLTGTYLTGAHKLSGFLYFGIYCNIPCLFFFIFIFLWSSNYLSGKIFRSDKHYLSSQPHTRVQL